MLCNTCFLSLSSLLLVPRGRVTFDSIVLFLTRLLSTSWALGRVIVSSNVDDGFIALFSAATAGAVANGSSASEAATQCSSELFFGPFWRSRRGVEVSSHAICLSFVLAASGSFLNPKSA